MTHHEELVKAFKEAISYSGTEDGVVLVGRIPLICKDIKTIQEDLGDIKKDVKWSTRYILIATGAVMILSGGIAWLFNKVAALDTTVSPAVKLEIQSAVNQGMIQAASLLKKPD